MVLTTAAVLLWLVTCRSIFTRWKSPFFVFPSPPFLGSSCPSVERWRSKGSEAPASSGEKWVVCEARRSSWLLIRPRVKRMLPVQIRSQDLNFPDRQERRKVWFLKCGLKQIRFFGGPVVAALVARQGTCGYKEQLRLRQFGL
jgi:hypothetical protein